MKQTGTPGEVLPWRYINEQYIFGSVEENQDPFRFVWDITSHMHPGTNVLTVRAGGQGLGLGLQDVTIEVGAPIPSANADLLEVTPAPTGPLETYAPKPAPRMPGVHVSSAGDVAFSSPAGEAFCLPGSNGL